MPIHIEAHQGEVAESVILVGDPDRATHIADLFLDDTICYTKYRHLFGYTGYYKGEKISVQTSGMGTPSLTIVVEELNMLGVKNIIRLGTCGTIRNEIQLGDTIIATASHSSHDICAREFPGASFSAAPDFTLTMGLYQQALSSQGNEHIHAGSILCSETFYESDFTQYEKFGAWGTLAVEMESYALFYLAAKYGIKSGTILTVSDRIFTHERADKALIQQSVEINTQSVLAYFAET